LSNLNLAVLTEGLKKRFASTKTTDETLERFLATRCTKTYDEYLALLSDATLIFERGCINMEFLLKLTISKAPSELKSLLFQYACSSGDWNTFIKQAEEASWMAFPDRSINSVESSKSNFRNQSIQNKTINNSVCIYHGKGNHSTEKCFTIIRLEKLGWRRSKHVREIKEHETEDVQENGNKFTNIYSCCSIKIKHKNPFFTYIKLNRGTHPALLDTGADVSLINIENIADKSKIEEVQEKIKTASGSEIKIKGIIRNLEVVVFGKKIKFSPLVCQGLPNYTILGIDVLVPNPDLLNDAFANYSRSVKEIYSLGDNLADVPRRHKQITKLRVKKNDSKEPKNVPISASKISIPKETLKIAPMSASKISTLIKTPKTNSLLSKMQTENSIIHAEIKDQFDTTEQETVVETPQGRAILEEFRDIFKDEITESVMCNTKLHKIDTGNASPICQKNYRVPVHFETPITEEIVKNLRLGIIRPSNSPWCGRIVPVSKKDGSVRMCIDFRALNKVTIRDKYPLPRIDEILDRLSGAKIFSNLDATSGYYQIGIDEKDKEKTAFAWKGGLYEFNRMPFGLCNAPATFQRAMDEIIGNCFSDFVIPYLDDIIIFSRNETEHLQHLNIVLNKLKASGLALNKKKCNFLKEEIKILGNVVSRGYIKPDPSKIETIKKYPFPLNLKELRAFLGLVNYCREYIMNYAELTHPLFNQLKGELKNSTKALIW
ncbi:Retrovirus-related Pol polyprotein from transposon, partial [Nosema granulosis]